MWIRTIEILIGYDVDETSTTTSENKTIEVYNTKADPIVIKEGQTRPKIVGAEKSWLSIRNNRIDFRYENTPGAGGDTLKLDIYNLGIETVNTLMSDKVKSITVSVGYEDEDLQVLCDGFITNVSGLKTTPNHVTSIWAVPKFQYMLAKDSQINKIVVKSDTLIEVIRKLVKQIGFTTEPKFYNIPDDILYSNIRGYIFDGTPKRALRDLGKQYGFFAKPTASTVNIVSRLSSTDSVQKLIDGRITKHSVQMNKVKGNPKVDVGLIVLVANLDAAINAGDVLDVSALILSNGKGTPQTSSILDVNSAASVLYRSDDLWKSMILSEYLITHVTHTGSNFSNTWDTIIEGSYFVKGTSCKKPGNGDPGFENVSPPEMDANMGVHQIPTMKVIMADGQGGYSGLSKSENGDTTNEVASKWIPQGSPVEGVGGNNLKDSEIGLEGRNNRERNAEQGKVVPALTPMPQPKGKGYDQQSEEADKKVGNTYSMWHNPNARTGGAPPTISGDGQVKSKPYGKGWSATNTPASNVLSPATRKLADIIAKGESGGDYNNIFNKNYTRNPDNKMLTNMTIGEVKALGQDNVLDTRTYKSNGEVDFPGSSASGRYQQLTSTLDQNAKHAGLKDSDMYNQVNQDKIFKASLSKMGLDDYLSGKENMSDEQLINKFSNEYAAVKNLKGEGEYDDDGANKGTISAEDVLDAVKAVRAEGME